jgi:hypothetical protein
MHTELRCENILKTEEMKRECETDLEEVDVTTL